MLISGEQLSRHNLFVTLAEVFSFLAASWPFFQLTTPSRRFFGFRYLERSSTKAADRLELQVLQFSELRLSIWEL